MNYRKLGRSGLNVSEVSLGSWLTYGGSVDNSEAVDCVRRAFDLGINFFDTANGYAGGRAEEVLGEALAGLPRDEVVVGTKVYWDAKSGTNHVGLSRKHMIESCEASLRRLGMDYVDLFQFHRFDEDTPVEESLWAIHDLQSQGKILYGGVSNWSGAQLRLAAATARDRNLRPLVSAQPIYNLLSRGAEEDLQAASLEHGLGWVVYSPLAQGVLTGKYRPGAKPAAGTRASDSKSNMWMGPLLKKPVLEKVKKMGALARKAGMTPAQLALAWVLKNPAVSSVITGASRVSQVEENVKAASFNLDAALVEKLDKLFPAQ